MRRADWGDGRLKVGSGLLHCSIRQFGAIKLPSIPNMRAALQVPQSLRHEQQGVEIELVQIFRGLLFQRDARIAALRRCGRSFIASLVDPDSVSRSPVDCLFFITCPRTLPRWRRAGNLSCKDYGRLK
jgi:hypothetical protein